MYLSLQLISIDSPVCHNPYTAPTSHHGSIYTKLICISCESISLGRLAIHLFLFSSWAWKQSVCLTGLVVSTCAIRVPSCLVQVPATLTEFITSLHHYSLQPIIEMTKFTNAILISTATNQIKWFSILPSEEWLFQHFDTVLWIK